MKSYRLIISLIIAGIVLVLNACSSSGGGGNSSSSQPASKTYHVNVTVTGLDGEGLVLTQANDEIAVTKDGSYTFGTSLKNGASYMVSVATQPQNRVQTCSVNNDSGNINNTDVYNVTVDCVTNSYLINVKVSGLLGSGLSLRNNDTTANPDSLDIPKDGDYHFSTSIASGDGYHVTVFVSPIGPTQTCTVNNAQGSVIDTDINNIEINCSTTAYQVGGHVSGLAAVGSGLEIRNSVTGESLPVVDNGAFSFLTQQAAGSVYAVFVESQPTSPAQSCVITSGTAIGHVVDVDIDTIEITCTTPNFSGSVDPNFAGGAGFYDIENNLKDDLGIATAVNVDNKIIVAGTSVSAVGVSYDFTMIRLNADGTRDTTFNNGNNDGFVRTNISTVTDSTDYLQAIVIDKNQNILATGYTKNGTGWDLVVARFDQNGVLDSSFGPNGDGIVVTDLGSSNELANDIAIQPDDKIVVVGKKLYAGYAQFAMVRYDSFGIPDPSFNGGDTANTSGIVTLALSNRTNIANTVAVTSDDIGITKILVAGYAAFTTGGGKDYALVQLNEDGSLDTSFGAAGTGIVTQHVGNTDIATAMAVEPVTKKILLTGYSSNGTNNDFAILRYLPDGTLDGTFDGDGIAVHDFAAGQDEAYGIAIDAAGRYVVTGRAFNGTDFDFALLRYLPDGTLDSTFGINGSVLAPLGGANDEAYALAIHPDGIVVAGRADNGTHIDFAAIRINE